jgi:hypothetical protein
MPAPRHTGPRIASFGLHLLRHYREKTRWERGRKMRRTHRGLGVAEGQMECCTFQESHRRPSCRLRLTMRRNSGRYRKTGSFDHCRHLVSGVEPLHMPTPRRRHRPQVVRREDRVGEWTCSCAIRGRRVSTFPPKSLTKHFSDDTGRMHRGTHQKQARERWHPPS